MDGLYLTPRELSERWSCSVRHVERLCQTGRLQAARLSGWRISLAAVEAYEAARANGAMSRSDATAKQEASREPIRPVFRVLEETGAPLPLPERWWEMSDDEINAASSAGADPRGESGDSRDSARRRLGGSGR